MSHNYYLQHVYYQFKQDKLIIQFPDSMLTHHLYAEILYHLNQFDVDEQDFTIIENPFDNLRYVLQFSNLEAYVMLKIKLS